MVTIVCAFSTPTVGSNPCAPSHAISHMQSIGLKSLTRCICLPIYVLACLSLLGAILGCPFWVSTTTATIGIAHCSSPSVVHLQVLFCLRVSFCLLESRGIQFLGHSSQHFAGISALARTGSCLFALGALAWRTCALHLQSRGPIFLIVLLLTCNCVALLSLSLSLLSAC